MEITLSDFYQIGMNAVKLFPEQSPPKPWLQLQAFRVLQAARGTEVTTVNLGAVPSDKDTPFFWSRKWHESRYNPNALEFDFPILTMYEIIGDRTLPFRSGGKQVHTVEIAVLDKYHEDCVTGPASDGRSRPVNQIYIDTEKLLKSALVYFSGMVGAYTSEDATVKMYYKPWLVKQKYLGRIQSFDVVYDMENTLNAYNQTTRFSRVEMPTQMIYGTKTQISFMATECELIEFNTEIEDFGVLAFEAGCKNC